MPGALDIVEWQLGFWRQNMDLSLQLMRNQQDQAIRFWRTQLSHIGPQAFGSDQAGARSFMAFSPMASAMKAAGEFGEAALEAQREALDAFRPH